MYIYIYIYMQHNRIKNLDKSTNTILVLLPYKLFHFLACIVNPPDTRHLLSKKMQLSSLLEQADEKQATKCYQEAEKLYFDVLSCNEKDFSEEQENVLKYKEQAALALLDLFVEQKQAEKIVDLTRKLRPFFGQVAKAKTVYNPLSVFFALSNMYVYGLG